MDNLLSHENKLWKNGIRLIAGVDEVGRGCIAGPVVAAAVVLPKNKKLLRKLSEVNDSKKLTSARRKALFPIIQECATDFGIGIVSANVIDQINILQATFMAMRRSLKQLDSFEHVLVDGNQRIPYIESQDTIIKGDSNSLSIAAASILAKVVRDEIMIALSEHYPRFYFEKHKGYPTKVHIEALRASGLSDIHRISFCRNLFTEKQTEAEQLSIF